MPGLPELASPVLRLSVLVALLVLSNILWVAVFWRLRRLSPDRFRFPGNVPKQENSAPRRISVIAAARDEQEVVGECLTSLLSQDYPDIQVILVDDQSADNTLAIAREVAGADSRLSIVEGQPTPEGWFGKSWALWQGVQHATGDWLLFTDADVIHEPQTLTKALNYAESENLQVLSLVPKVETHFFWEHFLYPVLPILVGPRWRLDEINDPNSDAALAAGGFILIRRAAYEAIGGHESVRGEIVEDVMIARRLKARNIPIRTLLAPDLLHTRMYKDTAELWEGLRRHACETLHRKWSVYFLSVLWTVAAIVVPLVALALTMGAAIIGPAFGPMQWLAAILAVSALAWPCLFHAVSGRTSSTPVLYCLLAPFGLLVYQVISGLSMWDLHVRGEILWKGRANRVTRP